MWLTLVFLLLVSALPTHAAQYYVDFITGSDSNNGTSTNTPWKRHPGMSSFSGSYSGNGADIFEMRRGVSWTSSGTLTVGVNGTSPSARYTIRGATNGWTATTPGARWVINRGGAVGHGILLPSSRTNIWISDAEIHNYTDGAGIDVNCTMWTTISNCYIHECYWGSIVGSPSPNQCNEQLYGGIINHEGANADLAGNYKFLITHCVISNHDGESNWVSVPTAPYSAPTAPGGGYRTGFGAALRSPGEVMYCDLGYWYWFQDHGGYLFQNNNWHDMVFTMFGQANCHEDFTYLDKFNGHQNQQSQNTRCLVFNNRSWNIPGFLAQTWFPNTGSANAGSAAKWYVWNNVNVNNGATLNFLSIDPDGENNQNNTKAIYTWNNSSLRSENTTAANSVGAGGAFFRYVTRPPDPPSFPRQAGNWPPQRCWILNNLCIDSDLRNNPGLTAEMGVIPDTKIAWNYLFSSGISAFNNGYETNTWLVPQSVNGVGIGAGTNLWNFCVEHNLPIEAFSDSSMGVQVVDNFVTGVFRQPLSRSPSGPWSIGATEYAASAPLIPSGQTKYGPQGAPLTYQVLSVGGVTSWGAANLPTGLSINSAGVISGTPTAAGTNTVTLSATNANGFDQETMIIGIANPAAVITVEASSANFGFLRMGNTNHLTVGLTNTGGTGTSLSWAVSAGGVFSVIGTASGTLGNLESTTVTVCYSPTTYGTNLGGLVFTGGGGATVALSGIAYNILTNGIQCVAVDNYVAAPFVTNGGFIRQGVLTTELGPAGFAIWGFYLPVDSQVLFKASVYAPHTGADSFFFSIDDFNAFAETWDWIPVNTGFTLGYVNSRGNGTSSAPQYQPVYKTLLAGWHTFTLFGREPDCQIITLGFEVVAESTATGGATRLGFPNLPLPR